MKVLYVAINCHMKSVNFVLPILSQGLCTLEYLVVNDNVKRVTRPMAVTPASDGLYAESRFVTVAHVS